MFARPRMLVAVADSVGGARQLSAIALLSGSLALAAADQTIAGAVAPDLKVDLHVDNTGIGLLVTAAYLLAAAGTIPFGILADRAKRVRLLAICALAWSASITIAGFAGSYGTLLVAQMTLGAGVGGAAPLVASLAGDVFPPGARGRALGLILAGEFAGAASGLLIAGEIAAIAPWRVSFWALAGVGPVLAALLLRCLPEPARGTQAARVSHAAQPRAVPGVDSGTAAMPGAGSVAAGAAAGAAAMSGAGAEPNVDPASYAAGESPIDPPAPLVTPPTHRNLVGRSESGSSAARNSVTPPHAEGTPAGGPIQRTGVAAAVQALGIEPRPRLVLDRDPADRPLAWAIRYVLAVPTNVVIIVSSALCYFYVAGVQTFAIVYLRGRFDLSQELATALLVVIGLGVISGMLVTGHLSDRLIARGHPAARVAVGGICFLAAVVAFAPAFSVTALALAMPLMFLGAAGLGGLNPPLDAARLDVVHFRLWGRAESVRAMCQNLIRASAPLIFGYLSTVLGSGDESAATQGGGAVGLGRAFLILLGLFVIGGIVLLTARRAYLRDVATAVASEAATVRGGSR